MNDMKFLELKPGFNKVRILTIPYQYMAHSNLIKKGEPHFGQKLKCPSLISGIECNICKEGNIFRPRWMLGVLSHNDNKTYLLDLGIELFRYIKQYAIHQSWGDPTKYSLDIYLPTSPGYRQMIVPIAPINDLDISSYVSQIDINKLLKMCEPSLEDLAIIDSKVYLTVSDEYLDSEDII